METFFSYIDKHQNEYVDFLKTSVSIKSVSADANLRSQVFKMADFLQTHLKQLGFIDIHAVDVGTQEIEGQTLALPPVLLASYGNDPSKKTVLVYGHYDVQPALLSDGWTNDPFTLWEEDGKLFGRGSTDDKGPILAWLCAIKAHRELGMGFPVNLKVCFEGMEESGSEGLEELIRKEAGGYFSNVDCVYWLGNTQPCITYGLRGISYFTITVKGPGRDLHSGLFGGAVHEPMTDLISLMNGLVKSDGTILIPGITKDVKPLTAEEKDLYSSLKFTHSDFHSAIAATNTIYDDKIMTLMHRWRYPSLSLHGIEGAFYGNGAKTVIPAKVIGKFSIRTVPNQEPKVIEKLVVDYIEKQFQSIKTKNTCSVECLHGGKAWISDINHWNYVAAARAIESVFGVKPDYTREGGSIPVTLTFQETLNKNVLLLPLGSADDGAHSINEKIDRRNYINGIKVLGAYLHQVAKQ